jgi:hypothetical protein
LSWEYSWHLNALIIIQIKQVLSELQWIRTTTYASEFQKMNNFRTG